jgi:hypothetical protein
MNHCRTAIWISVASLVLLIAAATPSIAQQSEDVHASGSNILRVGSGSTTDITGKESPKHYFEEIANARLFFQYFSIGLRYEMDDPSEVGRSYQDKAFRRRWITYRKDQLELQAGDVSALFGRGLAINLFESRPLNYDSWLDGASGKTELKIPKEWVDIGATVGVKAVGGRETFYPIDTMQLPMQISARAANAEIGLFKKKFLLGAAFVEANTSTSLAGPFNSTIQTNREVNQPDFYFDLNTGEFEAFAEWTENRSHVHVTQLPLQPLDTVVAGHAVYASLSYSNPIIGLTFEYKNYDYFEHAPGNAFTNRAGKLPISSPPEVYRDFTYSTITRSTHAVNFDDEVGLQLEANITAIPQFTINLNGAASSTHNWYGADGKSAEKVGILPKFSNWGFYPFWEYFGEVEWNFDPDQDLNYARLAVHRRSDVIAYNIGDSSAETKWSTTLAAKLQYLTTPSQSIMAILEHQWAYDGSLPTPDKRRLNELLTLQYSFNPLITFGGILDLSVQYEAGPYHLEDTWQQGFVSVRLGGSHVMLISYGSERGGINCTGGICRYVPPFKGLRLTLTSQI